MFVRLTRHAAAAVAVGYLALGLAAPCAAQPVETINISFADLNLDNLAGRERLDRRIAAAASQLCGDYSLKDLGRASEVRACQEETIADTRPQRDAAFGLRGNVEVTSADRVMRVSRAAN